MARDPQPIMPDDDDNRFTAMPEDIEVEDPDEVLSNDDNPDSIEGDLKLIAAQKAGRKPEPETEDEEPQPEEPVQETSEASAKPEPGDAEILDRLLQKNPEMVKAKYAEYTKAFSAVPAESRPKPVASWDQVPKEIKDTLEVNGLTAWAKGINDRQDMIHERFLQVESEEIFLDAVAKQKELREYAKGEIGRVFTADDVVRVQTAATLDNTDLTTAFHKLYTNEIKKAAVQATEANRRREIIKKVPGGTKDRGGDMRADTGLGLTKEELIVAKAGEMSPQEYARWKVRK